MRLYLLFGATLCLAMEPTVPSHFHNDWRSSVIKVDLLNESRDHLDKLEGVSLAWAFLKKHHQRYGLQPSLDNLEYTQTDHSLLGRHIRFSQTINGVNVHGAEIIVSITSDHRIFMVYNNTFPFDNLDKVPAKPALNNEAAYDIAWRDLKVHGDLMVAPDVQLVYLPSGPIPQLVYRVQLAVEAPYGYWEHRIDALSGELLDVKLNMISRKTIDDRAYRQYQGPIWNREQTFATWQTSTKQINPKGKMANGTADVFDPDPVTTLQNDNLEDGTSASTFDSAYFNRNLLDITESAGQFSLTGPWVAIQDFDPPTNPPSTTANGAWTARRGDNAFNDAMTYFHIDQSQRYMQSLGFTGATGIQFAAIGADSDGANGADNSFFAPGPNLLVFGHGCVDDNEDSFVILHEYGHAIQWSINMNFFGGDTGGMGEGFGDYWAGSYRLSTPNGRNFHPEWAFPWDGHNQCWGGRLMDVTSAQYDPNSTYGAHQFVNGALSDELWSTPLFQTLISLTGMGVAREEVDRIILQSHFGLGSDIRISDMAQIIVNTALMLYPNGPHAMEFHDKFAVHNIQTTVNTPPPPATARSLVFAWVSNNAQFESIVVVDNFGSTTANLTLTAQRSSGPNEIVTRSVPANGFLREQASSLFPSLGAGSGYTVLVESDVTSVLGGWVTNNLEAASGKSPSQGVAVLRPDSTAGERVGTKLLFPYLPITDGLTSAPVVVNLGTSSTSVTMRFYNQQGQLVTTDSTTLASMDPLRPFAAVANNLVPAGSGDLYMVAESSGALITGVGFVFNNFSEPAIGNVTVIP